MHDYTRDFQRLSLATASTIAICTRRFYSPEVDYGYAIINRQVSDVVHFVDACLKQEKKEKIYRSLSQESKLRLNAIAEFFDKQIENIQEYKQDKWKIGLFAGELLEAAHLAAIDATIICKVASIQPYKDLEVALRSLLGSMYNALNMEDEIVQGGMDMYMASLQQ